ncbi:MAG TPA: nucleoside triphosphate pyrophosphatase [Actinomycetaceae bacterium]|nr:nucleoside triphosphate pyrophosphatase [Actinomycetaceae bacterium]
MALDDASSAPCTLVLASASPARLDTLLAAGIEATVRVSEVDEDAVLSAAALSSEHSFGPVDQVLTLARAKAEDVAAAIQQEQDTPPAIAPDFVIGCDSLLELDGAIMGKPLVPELARERWKLMRGNSGLLHTGHWLVDMRSSSGKVIGEGAVSTARVHFADLTDAEIDAYLATGEPLRVAGGFTIDGFGGPYISRIEGDHHGVVGLSLPVLRMLLARRRVGIHELWSLS